MTTPMSSPGSTSPSSQPESSVRPPHRRRRTHSSSITGSRTMPRRRRPTDSSIADTAYSELEDNQEEEWEHGDEICSEGRRRRNRDEPTSPAVVVFYVTAVYFIFQILTRSDDLEFLSHLPSTSSLLQSSRSLGGSNLHSDMQQHPYHSPYHLPHIPSPIPTTSSESPSMVRTILGILVYPIYLLVTLLAVPMPLLLNAAHLITSILITILYPFTSAARMMLHTFVVTPWGVIRSILDIFYPIYTFIGGVVGVGCVMGLGAGWAGSISLDYLTGQKRRSRKSHRSAQDRPRSDRSERSKRSSVAKPSSRLHEQDQVDDRVRGYSPESEQSFEKLYTPVTSSRREEGYYRDQQKGKKREGYPTIGRKGLKDEGRTSAREGAIGVRRRTHVLESK